MLLQVDSETAMRSTRFVPVASSEHLPAQVAWREEKAFAGPPASLDFDTTMAALGDSAEAK